MFSLLLCQPSYTCTAFGILGILVFIADIHSYLCLGDRMNFISTFDTTKHQVIVKDRDFSVIQSLSGQTRHSGIRMEHAMNREWNYFEVKILNTVGDGEIGIGVGHKDYLLYRLPGWDDDSIGYHADDGGLFHEAGFPELHGPTCTTGDRMGCGVDFTSSDDGHVNVWFTKNGQVVISPRQVDLPVYVDSKLYPLIGMKWAGQEVRYLGHWKKTPPTEDFGKPTAIQVQRCTFSLNYLMC